MKTLVTGGAGFIGSHLVRALVERGDEVVVLDSLEEQVHGDAQPDLPAGVELIVGNVGDRDAADRALAGVDRGRAPRRRGRRRPVDVRDRPLHRAQHDGHRALPRARRRRSARCPSRLVVASSMSIYGEGEYECDEHGRVAPGPRPEEQLLARAWELACPTCGRELRPVGTSEAKPLIPTSIYAINKRDHEEMCLVTGAAYGIPTVALRFFNVYGPGQALSNPYTGVAAIFASRLLNGRPPVIFEDGEQSRDFTHVSDIVQGILLALESEAAVGHAVNLGTGRPTTVAEVARGHLGRDWASTSSPIRNEQYRAGDIRHCFADPARARELLGFEAAIDASRTAWRELVEWLQDQEAVDRVDDATQELAARGLAR